MSFFLYFADAKKVLVQKIYLADHEIPRKLSISETSLTCCFVLVCNSKMPLFLFFQEVSSRKSRHTSVHHLIKCPLHDKHCNESLLGNFTDVQGNIITNEPLLPGKQIEIVNDNDNLRWKITVPIGNGFIRNRTNVKAMTGGKKLIITGFKPATTDSGEEYMHQYNDKLSLPHCIDAFAVKATMSREGTLKISAPIISTSSTTMPTLSLSKAVVT